MKNSNFQVDTILYWGRCHTDEKASNKRVKKKKATGKSSAQSIMRDRDYEIGGDAPLPLLRLLGAPLLEPEAVNVDKPLGVLRPVGPMHVHRRELLVVGTL